MAAKNDITTTIVSIKNMLSNCCIRVIRNEFEKNNITVESIRLGEATISFDKSIISLEVIDGLLEGLGFGIIVSRDLQIVEKIKRTVIDLIWCVNRNILLKCLI